MDKNLIMGGAAGIALGFIIGYVVGANTAVRPAPAAMAAPAPQGPQPIPGADQQLAMINRIAELQHAVEANPKDLQAWTQLGHLYFDTHQHQKSVEAYAKAIALDPKHPAVPDLLTDQGIMYRDLKQFDKALANFAQAQKLNPRHVQSWFNTGIVYGADLNQPAKAAVAFRKVIELAPGTPDAQRAAAALAEMPGAAAKP